MNPGRALLIAAAATASLPLGGCVAAAIPLAAAGLMTKSRLDQDGKPPLAAGTALPARTAPVAQQELATAGGHAVILTGLTEMPPPSAGADERVRQDLTRFSVYALQRAKQDPASAPRSAALLASPGDLSAERQQCDARPPVILIDLDPGRATFDPLDDIRPVAGLAPALASLRQQGVAIAWQSRLGENFSDAVRQFLRSSGLDAGGEDRLLLAQSLEQRQQTLRTDLSATHCIVAMLGDERSDFDELYLYLKDPDAAVRLESMVGDGWFLTERLFEENDNES